MTPTGSDVPTITPAKGLSAAGDVLLAAVEVTIPKNKSVHQLLGCPHIEPLGFLKLNLMHYQRRLQFFRVKNIGSVVELNGVAFCLAPPYVKLNSTATVFTSRA